MMCVYVQADEAYCIGPPPSSESYLNQDRIMEVAKATGAQVSCPIGQCREGVEIWCLLGHPSWLRLPVREQGVRRAMQAGGGGVCGSSFFGYREDGS